MQPTTPRTPRPRLAIPAVAALLALTLSACGGSSPTPSPTPTPSATAESATPTPTPSVSIPVSDSIDTIRATGAFGEDPTVVVPTPFAIDRTRSRVLIEGNGPAVEASGIVEVNYVGYNGRTGEYFDSSFRRGEAALFSLQSVVPGFATGLAGHKAGSRVLVVIPGSEGYDAAGGSPGAGIEVGDTLVFVIDVIATSVTAASGSQAGGSLALPVTTDAAGRPTVTLTPGATPPSDLVVQRVITGTQRPVGELDYVLVHYRTWSWKSGQLLEDKFDTPDAGAIAETIPAWRTGIVGQPIGSRVLLIAPPEHGYPEGSNNPPVDKGDTVVYVVDILFSSALG